VSWVLLSSRLQRVHVCSRPPVMWAALFCPPPQMGTPERPLSDLGRVSYHGYWTREILAILRTHEGPITIKVGHPACLSSTCNVEVTGVERCTAYVEALYCSRPPATPMPCALY
jgi:hypothetical protein